MASYAVAISKEATLVASTADAVTLSGNFDTVEVLNETQLGASGAANIYAKVNATPTVGGADTYVVQPGQSVQIPTPGAADVISLISSGTPIYAVTGLGVGYRRTNSYAVPAAAPTGAAGGDLAGTYPNPTLAAAVKGLTAHPLTTSGTAAYGELVIADATSGALTVTLPAPAANKQSIVVKKIDGANNVTISHAAAELIDGAATVVLSTQWASKRLVTDGTNWFVS